ncbi:M50 family metallopeptidase [Atopobium minutum]|uniref:RIP metalloprotease RseP n=1 Tax=Atopobium minutum 10063974 TaxID=997872 RepID=N2BYA2_9ACTN|nr:M50 family metallopeptidase [Atopobium minutum]EMZ41909.1 RIP metalloprotease RseP [Atopobium minutum 10063974]
MPQFVSTISAIFWGVLVLSILVTAHEAGHYFAARLCKARVTEFFIGMPSRHKWSWRSKKHGTEFGITPILLGGYTRICGMSPLNQLEYARGLELVQTQGSIEVEQAAQQLDCSVEDAYDIFETLVDWATIEPDYESHEGDKPKGRSLPNSYKTTLRDSAFNTKFDDSFDENTELMQAGTAQPLTMTAQDFLDQERSKIYVGKKFWARFFMIFAGPVASFITGVLFMVLSLSVVGQEVPTNDPMIGAVVEHSLAQQAGLQSGDRLLAVDDHKVDSFTDLAGLLKDKFDKHEAFELSYQRDGSAQSLQITPAQNDTALGIYAPTKWAHLSVGEALNITWKFSVQIAQFAAKLIVPTQTMNVVSQSSSIVGISVMASQAASSGLGTLLLFAAQISLSLAFMNLLPIPPLDGGKILIEFIQVIIRKPLSERTQSYISFVGIALFACLFLLSLKNDILRFI